MKRLTGRAPDGTAYLYNMGGTNAAIDHLAAYEDTGLEPEEIGKWKEALRKLLSNISVTGNRMIEIANAESEGRLLVPPCKVGDTVWYIPRGTRKIYSGICHCVSIQKGGVNIHLYDFDGDAATYPASRVFLTREEAEAALEKEAKK